MGMRNSECGIQKMAAASMSAIALSGLCGMELATAQVPEAPVPSGIVTQWVVLGPFANPDENPEWSKPAGAPLSLHRDYLQPIGGESNAHLQPGVTVDWTGIDGTSGTASTREVTTPESGILDFVTLYDKPDYKLAYAQAEIQSAVAQKVLFFLGSDDGVRVWLNGEMIHENYVGRGYSPRQDTFEGKLEAGSNTLLVKVENRYGGWQLGVEVYGEAGANRLREEMRHRANIARFQHHELVPANGLFVFPIGGFPEIVWDDAETVKELVGETDYDVRWFDKDLNEVTRAESFGRYGMLAEGTLPDGTPFRRQRTFACAAEDGRELLSLVYAQVPFVPGVASLESWEANAPFISEFAGWSFRRQLRRTEEGARLVALLQERDDNPVPSPQFTDSPQVAHDDYHLRLKLKLDGREEGTRPLAPPRNRSADPALVIREGTLAEAGFKPGAVEAMDAVLREWAEVSREPHVTLVARNGVIVLHDAYGTLPDGQPITREFRSDLASITKAITGTLFGRLLDQGFVELDDPIGHVIPGFPVVGADAPTWRMCFTHTIGSDGHWEWGGVHNASFENVFLNGLSTYEVGRVHRYNGMSYNLAGKGMEYLTGKSAMRLFDEGLYGPLGIEDVHMSVLASSARLSAFDLAKFGQLLANRGSYGDMEFLSEDTFEKLLPRNLSEFYPGLDIEWGIGLTWMRTNRTDVPSNAPLEERFILSPNTIGHGSATSCILQVDLDQGLVITQVRMMGGRDYDRFLRRFLTAVSDHLVDE
jgi:CubicO group peptidase (beta-lactamase class C family)